MESLILVSSCMKSKEVKEHNICKERRRGHFIVCGLLRVATPNYILFPGIFILELTAIKTDQVAGLFCVGTMTVSLQSGR